MSTTFLIFSGAMFVTVHGASSCPAVPDKSWGVHPMRKTAPIPPSGIHDRRQPLPSFLSRPRLPPRLPAASPSGNIRFFIPESGMNHHHDIKNLLNSVKYRKIC